MNSDIKSITTMVVYIEQHNLDKAWDGFL